MPYRIEFDHQRAHESRVHNQCQEVRPDPYPGSGVLQGSVQHCCWMVLLPSNRLEALVNLVTTFMQVGRSFPARLWLQLLGVMAATIPSVVWAHLNMRPVQFFLKQNKQGLDFPIVLIQTLVPCLCWWVDRSKLVMGLPFQPAQPELTVRTNSSMEGREATCSWQTMSKKRCSVAIGRPLKGASTSTS